jgi:membrane-associated protein
VENITYLLDLVLHIDKHLGVIVQQYGAWAYGFLNAIVFAETGLVIFPFLPGDSLLFIAGAFSANGSFDILWLNISLITAAVAGNTLNYLIGRYLGQRFNVREFRWLDKNALDKTHAFYEKHGGKTIILARFVPIVRTFAPFVAGLSEMTFAKFQLFNIVGAGLWVISLTVAGYFFGNIPFIRDNLNVIVLLGVGAAAIPVAAAAAWKFLKLIRQKH